MTDENTSPQHQQHKHRTALLLLCVLIAVAVFLRVKTPNEPKSNTQSTSSASGKLTYEFEIFSTYARVTIWGDEKDADQASEAIAAYTQQLHNTINVYDPESELSHLNASAYDAPFSCSDVLWDILEEARRAYRETDGAFDISVGPLMHLWGFHRKRATWPTESEIAETLRIVGLDKVTFDDTLKTTRFGVSGMRLDLGGIAKGYALDKVVQICQQHGLETVLVDLGGNIFCSQIPPPGRESFVIGIRDPINTEGLLGRAKIRNMAIATSGNYEKKLTIGGKKVAHIIDPRTGQPVQHYASVTLVTPKGVDSDIYSTAIFVGGPSLIEKLRKHSPETTVITATVDEKGEPTITTHGPLELLE